MAKDKKRLYPLESLTTLGDKIPLDENDNIASVRVIVSNYVKLNIHLGWELKVVKDHFTNKMMIIRTK